MKKLISLALGLASLCCVSFATQLPNFSPIYYFGDSLTDMGNNTQGDNNCVNTAAPVTNKTGGAQFNGRTWADINQYGFFASPSRSGGNDFAFGGATVNPMTVFSTTPPFNASTTYDITTQEIYGTGPGQFNVRQHHISSNALIAYWGGANDILDTFENAQALTLKFFGSNPTSPQARQAAAQYIQSVLQGGPNPYFQFDHSQPAQFKSIIQADLTTIQAEILQFYAMGARNFLFVGMPDLSQTPLAASNTVNPALQLGLLKSVQPQLKQISLTWNAQLQQLLSTVARNRYLPGIRVYFFNPFPLMDSIIASGGIVNGAKVFSQTNQQIWCVPNSTTGNGNADSFMFFNFIHPTSRLHAVIAYYIRNDVTQL